MQTLRNIRLRDVCRARIECTGRAGFGEGDSAHRRYRKHEPGSPCSIGDGTMVEGVRRMDWRMSGCLDDSRVGSYRVLRCASYSHVGACCRACLICCAMVKPPTWDLKYVIQLIDDRLAQCCDCDLGRSSNTNPEDNTRSVYCTACMINPGRSNYCVKYSLALITCDFFRFVVTTRSSTQGGPGLICRSGEVRIVDHQQKGTISMIVDEVVATTLCFLRFVW